MTRLDKFETPIDKLAEDVKLGTRLIKDLDQKLKQVETEVRDAPYNTLVVLENKKARDFSTPTRVRARFAVRAISSVNSLITYPCVFE